MKLVCADYAGFKSVVTELGVPTEIFYQGDASSTYTPFIVAYYNAAPYNVIVYRNVDGVLISTVTADYATAVRISAMLSVEV